MIKDLGKSFVGIFTDPGAVHTGFTVVKVHDKTFQILAASEVEGLWHSAQLVHEAYHDFGARLWCYEGFRLYMDKANVKVHSEFEEVQVIGAMRLAAMDYPHLVVHKQFAHQIKVKPYEDSALRTMGFNLRSFPSGHTRDALRHFLRFWCAELKYGYPKVVNNYGYPAKVSDPD